MVNLCTKYPTKYFSLGAKMDSASCMATTPTRRSGGIFVFAKITVKDGLTISHIHLVTEASVFVDRQKPL